MTKRITVLLLLILMICSLSACSDDNTVEDYRAADVGSYIKFGSYEQDNNTQNGNESIKWLVLAKENNRLLIISKDILAYRQFHSEDDRSLAWENCELRKWLNDDFYQEAFSVEEQSIIETTYVGTDLNSHGDEYQGNDTQDKVFILSASEAAKYFSSDSDRVANNTKAVKAYLSSTFHSDSDEHSWWLRTRVGGIQFGDGSLIIYFANVGDDGSINDENNIFLMSDNENDYGVRPALWINLNSWQE